LGLAMDGKLGRCDELQAVGAGRCTVGTAVCNPRAMPGWDGCREPTGGGKQYFITEMGILCMAAEYGPSILFCMPSDSHSFQ
jgi:hypothetical protein